MGKLAVYESWKDNRTFTKNQIKDIYGIDEDFDYYCDYIKSRISIDNRTELSKLKNEIENKNISKVIIRSQNHISRDMGIMLDFMEFVSNNNCEVIDTSGFNHTNFYKFHKEVIIETIKENQAIQDNRENNLEGVLL